jgi:SAM-dependent methyltransferase
MEPWVACTAFTDASGRASPYRVAPFESPPSGEQGVRDMATESLRPEYFDRMYADSADPWAISQGWYEERKRRVVEAVLPRERYRRAFEPGCGNGILTRRLAGRCDHVLAWDGAEAAVTSSRRNLAGVGNVDVRQARVPDWWPEGRADLIVVSEIGYYLMGSDLDRLIERACASLEDGGTLIAVHWRREAPDYPLGGDDVHSHFFGRPNLSRVGGYADDDFRLDIFAGGSHAPSVAEVTGVVARPLGSRPPQLDD